MTEAWARRAQNEPSVFSRLLCCDKPQIAKDGDLVVGSTDSADWPDARAELDTGAKGRGKGDGKGKGKDKKGKGKGKEPRSKWDGGLPVLETQLPSIAGSWAWVREANDKMHRQARLEAANQLQEAFRAGGYAMQAGRSLHRVKFQCCQRMLETTRTISCSAGLSPLGKSPDHKTEFISHGGNCIQLAAEFALLEGRRVAAVNAASAYHAGGGFSSGGRHALEEAFCSQTTLYPSLQKAVESSSKGMHIPEDGVLLSPDVEIFRRGTDQGYALQMRPIPIAAVVSVAMYNKNGQVRDAPVDAPSDPAAYELGTSRKLQAMVHGAILANADCLIVPDVGCGVFHNDPTVIGRLVGRAVQERQGYFKKVVFTGKPGFCTAALSVLMPGTAPEKARSSKSLTGAKGSKKAIETTANCVVCGKSLSGTSDSVSLLLDSNGRRADTLLLLHTACSDRVGELRPDHTAMALPQAAADPQSFLRALDVDGNGTLSKEEVYAAFGAICGGAFASLRHELDEQWQSWDADGNGTLCVEEVSPIPNALVEWVQRCAKLSERT